MLAAARDQRQDAGRLFTLQALSDAGDQERRMEEALHIRQRMSSWDRESFRQAFTERLHVIDARVVPAGIQVDPQWCELVNQVLDETVREESRGLVLLVARSERHAAGDETVAYLRCQRTSSSPHGRLRLPEAGKENVGIAAARAGF
jgi:hypothetical protein